MESSREVAGVEVVIVNAPFFMKALWQAEIRQCINGARRSARIFVIILATVWMRLMGL
jgi:hypothetical protein